MRLKIKNFGRHADLTIETGEPVLLAVGVNRVGKTTLRDAVEFVLLGTCALRGFPQKQDVGRYMIRRGTDRAVVELGFDSWAVRRTLKPNGGQKIELDRNGNGGFVEVTGKEFAAALTADPAAVRVALDAEHYWRADATERRALLVALKDASGVTAADILDRVPSEVTLLAKLSTDFALWLEEVVARVVSDGFTAANAIAVEARRAHKRLMAEAEAKLVEVPDPLLEDGTDCRVESVDEMRDGLSAELSELDAAKRHSERVRGGLEADLRRAREQAEAAAARRSEALDRVHEFEAVAPLAEAERMAAALWKDAEAKSVAAGKEYARLIGELRVLDQTPKAGSASWEIPERCPVAPFPIPCPVKPKQRDAAQAEGDAERERNAEAHAVLIRDAREAADDAANALAEAERVAAAARTALKDAAESRRAREQAEGQLTLAEKSIRDIEVTVARLEAEAETLTDGPSQEQLEFFAAQIRRREAKLERRLAWETATDRNASASAEVERQLARVAWWDALEKALRPDGIEAQLAAMSSGGLADWLKMGAGLADVAVDDALQLTVNGWPVAVASKSEQICAGAILQVAVAAKSGVPLVVIDELDALDGTWRAAFAAFAAEAVGAAPIQIVALATSEADPPSAPPAGFATAWLRASGATMIEGADAGGES